MKQEKENDAITRLIDVVPNTTIDQIESNLKLVKNKKVLSRLMGVHFKISSNSVYNHWFGAGLSIPLNSQEDALEFIIEYLKDGQ